jgi:cytoskeletal protein RodZ
MNEAKQINQPDNGESKAVDAVSPGKLNGDESEASLGRFLMAAREKRALSRDDVVKQTRIPAHYLGMIESSDYALISDQLYVVPFLRRYAVFLGLDPEEIAMRFVREVQRADNAPAARMYEPVVVARKRRSRILPAIMVLVIIGAIAVLFKVELARHQAESEPAAATARTAPENMPPASVIPAGSAVSQGNPNAAGAPTQPPSSGTAPQYPQP